MNCCKRLKQVVLIWVGGCNMYLTSYIHSDKLLDEIIEQYGMPPAGQELQGPPPVEFEEVKKFLLFEKFKNFKTKFETADIDQSDKRVRQLDEFFNLIFVFYSSFSYNDLVKLLNRLIDIMSEVTGIKVEPSEPEPTPVPEAPQSAPEPNPEAPQPAPEPAAVVQKGK